MPRYRVSDRRGHELGIVEAADADDATEVLARTQGFVDHFAFVAAEPYARSFLVCVCLDPDPAPTHTPTLTVLLGGKES